jgi:hypothetical protein
MIQLSFLSQTVIPAKAGIQLDAELLWVEVDSRLRGNDDMQGVC